MGNKYKTCIVQAQGSRRGSWSFHSRTALGSVEPAHAHLPSASISSATKVCQQRKALSGLWDRGERLHPTLLCKRCCRGTFLTGQPSGGFTAPLSAFGLRFKRRREKYNFPGGSSLVTLLKYRSSDKWAWQQFMGVWLLKQCHCSPLSTYTLSNDRSISKAAFPSMAVPIQTHRSSSRNQLSKSMAKPPCFISP